MRCGKFAIALVKARFLEQFLFGGKKTYFWKKKQCATCLLHTIFSLYTQVAVLPSEISQVNDGSEVIHFLKTWHWKKVLANFTKSIFGLPNIHTNLATLRSRKKWETSHGSPQVKATCLPKKQLQKHPIHVRVSFEARQILGTCLKILGRGLSSSRNSNRGTFFVNRMS